MRYLALLVVVAVVGCDRLRSKTDSVATVPGSATSATPSTTLPRSSITNRQEQYETEEQRVKLKDVDLKLLSPRLRKFVADTRIVLRKRPFDEEALNLYIDDVNAGSVFFNSVDLWEFYVFIGEHRLGQAYADKLRLTDDLAEKFKMKLGMIPDDKMAKSIRRCIDELLRVGVKEAPQECKDELRDGGFAQFLANVKD